MVHQFARLADGSTVCNCRSFWRGIRVRIAFFSICTISICFFSAEDFVVVKKSFERLRFGAAKGTKSDWKEKRVHSVLTDGPGCFPDGNDQTEKNATNAKATIDLIEPASHANGLSNAIASDRNQDSSLTVTPIVYTIKNYSDMLADLPHNTSSTNRSEPDTGDNRSKDQATRHSNSTTSPVSKSNMSSSVHFNASVVAPHHNKTRLVPSQDIRPNKTTAAKWTQTASSGAAQPTNKTTGTVIKEPIVESTSCRRPCPNYNNIIVFSYWNRAGLRDRLLIIAGMSELAGYLCARVYLSRPTFWLTPNHNQGREVDVRMTWSEFVLSRFLDDRSINNSSALVDWVNPENVSLPPLIENITQSPKYENWLHVRTLTSHDIIADVELLEAFSFLGVDQPQGFIWEIRAYYFSCIRELTQHMSTRRHPSTILLPDDTELINYSSNTSNLKWRRDMQPFAVPFDVQPLNSGCQYATSDVPSDTQQLVQRIFDFVRENVTTSTRQNALAKRDNDRTPISPQPLIGYYHVRRGDSADWCNTSLVRVEQYLNCSLGESLTMIASTKTTQRRQVVLLFSSDERDKEYRNEIARLVKQQERYKAVVDKFSVSFVDLDELGQTIISEAVHQGQIPAWRLNNVYLYQLIFIIEQGRPEISFRLEHRRDICPNCTHLNLSTLL